MPELDEETIVGNLLEHLIWASGAFESPELMIAWRDSGANQAIANGQKLLETLRAKRRAQSADMEQLLREGFEAQRTASREAFESHGEFYGAQEAWPATKGDGNDG